MAVRSSRVRIFSWSWAVQTGPHTHMAVRACPVLDGRAEKQRFLVKKVKKGKWSKRASGQKGKWSKRASGQKGQKGQARGGAVHEPSSLPGKPTDETPGKGRNRSWQPFGLERERERERERRHPALRSPRQSQPKGILRVSGQKGQARLESVSVPSASSRHRAGISSSYRAFCIIHDDSHGEMSPL